MMFTKSIIAAVLSASMVNAHMIMSTPVPYDKDNVDNSPLLADGSNFPCKASSYKVTEENKISIGESVPLRFEGSATHGGGSCQISLTEDRAPTKQTSWKVIKSIEGGCPANVDGNLGDNSGMEDPYHFNFTVPDGIEPGKYTLAWTWFNRIGNREMYMNCAPVTISGGSSKRSSENLAVEKRSANFPPMFVANVNGCTTKEGVDIRFPQPGDDVEKDGNEANLAPEGSEACTGQASFGGSGDSGSGSSGSGSGSGSGSSAEPTTAPTSSAAPDPVPAPTQTSAPVVPQPVPSSTQPAPAPSASSGGSSGSSSSAGTLSGSCSPEGQWNCIAGSSFQRCAGGQWTPAQQLAAGTKCDGGQASELSVSASKRAIEISKLRFRKRTIGDSNHA